jgi:translation initiation factor 1
VPNDDRELVYSTDGSLPLPVPARKGGRPKGSAPVGPALPDDGFVRVGCERRRGGSVTLVYGLAASELQAVAGDLKKRCGTGGTVKDGVVALQGDKRDAVLAYLAERGRRTKRMGG